MAAINNCAAAENLASKKTTVEELLGDDNDPFESLPDETIIEILVRVNDEKSRRRCVALNKRMSCLVPLAEPVYIDIPLDPWVLDHYNNVRFLPGESEFPVELVVRLTRSSYVSVEEIIQYYIKTASECLRSRGPVVGAPIQHVTVKLPPFDKTVFGGYYYRGRGAWNLEYSGVEGALIKSCALLGYLHYCIPMTDRIEVMARCMRFGAILQPMVEQLVRDHETLCQVTIVTECGFGRLHISKEEISEMRGWMNTNKKKKKKKKKINDGILSSMKLNMKMWGYFGIGLFLVTDPKSHHTIEDVKIVIDTVLDRSRNLLSDEKNIKEMRRMMMKDKEKLPPCIREVTNSEWHWKY